MFVFALAAGALVANIYYSQALVTVLNPAFGLPVGLAGLSVFVTQLGYAFGLMFGVSLADLIENRRLILIAVAITVAGLSGATFATSAPAFFASLLVIGVGAAGAHIIIPFTAHFAREERRGAAIGYVMAGLITGIMLSRPLANLIAFAFGWRAVFGAAAVLCAGIFVVLWFHLPERRPNSELTYRRVLASAWNILRTTPALQRRTIYQATMFGMFNLFWTAAPLVLVQRFGLDQRGIALFALAGAGGVLAAPIAGDLADRGHTLQTTLGAMLVIAVSFAVTSFAVAAGLIVVLTIAAIALDAAMQGNQIVSQRLIYGIDPSARGRINSVYMTAIFLAGSAGSLVAGFTYSAGGWPTTAATGVAFSLMLLAYFVTEPREFTPV